MTAWIDLEPSQSSLRILRQLVELVLHLLKVNVLKTWIWDSQRLIERSVIVSGVNWRDGLYLIRPLSISIVRHLSLIFNSSSWSLTSISKANTASFWRNCIIVLLALLVLLLSRLRRIIRWWLPLTHPTSSTAHTICSASDTSRSSFNLIQVIFFLAFAFLTYGRIPVGNSWLSEKLIKVKVLKNFFCLLLVESCTVLTFRRLRFISTSACIESFILSFFVFLWWLHHAQIYLVTFSVLYCRSIHLCYCSSRRSLLLLSFLRSFLLSHWWLFSRRSLLLYRNWWLIWLLLNLFLLRFLSFSFFHIVDNVKVRG